MGAASISHVGTLRSLSCQRSSLQISQSSKAFQRAQKEWGEEEEEGATYVVPINAVLGLAVLPDCARVQTGQEGDCVDLVGRWLIIMHKLAGVPLAAGAPQEVVVAELVVILAPLHRLENGLIDGDGFI